MIRSKNYPKQEEKKERNLSKCKKKIKKIIQNKKGIKKITK